MFVFFFNDTATTEIYTLSLHDALPIFHILYLSGFRNRASVLIEWAYAYFTYQRGSRLLTDADAGAAEPRASATRPQTADRKSTRLNSSHANISYAVFCLKKKKI